jgi:hypothetical protein
MRVLKRNPWLTGLGTVLSLLLWCGSARADATTDQSGSVLFFPKVIADGTRDTLIQITNTHTMPVNMHCEYVNATGRCTVNDAICTQNSDCPAGQTCDDIICQAGDFPIFLTRQQPTIWRVSTGRDDSPTGPNTPGECQDTVASQECPGTWFLPVPTATGGDFRGYLICYITDANSSPLGQNSVKGKATIQTLGTSQISSYNAVAVRSQGGPTDTLIEFNNDDFNACPATQVFNHYREGADNVVASGQTGVCPNPGDCPVTTELTLVPCSLNFADVLSANPPTATAQFRICDEMESCTASAATTFSCWLNSSLGDIPGAAPQFTSLATTFAKTRVRTSFGLRCVGGDDARSCGGGRTAVSCLVDADCNAGVRCHARLCNDDEDCGGNDGENTVCRPQPGLLAVTESFHASANSSVVGTAAANAHSNGSRGQCQVPNVGFTGASCSIDDDCESGEFCATDTIAPRVED